MATLRELERVHTDATGTNPGRRWGTDQLNRSLFLALVGQFQRFSRDLHDEAVAVHEQFAPVEQQQLIRRLMSQGRKLDIGNPRPSALGSDFALVGVTLISDLNKLGAQAQSDLDDLDHLIEFRNGISHGNESAVQAVLAQGRIKATKKSYGEYRKTLDRLATTIDHVVAASLAAMLNIPAPW